MALPLSLLVLVVAGALASAVWIQATRDQQLTRGAVRLGQAASAAEAGLVAAIVTGLAGDSTLPVGSLVAFAGRLPSSGGWFRGRVERVNTVLLLIRVEGFSPDSLARQQVGLLVKRDPGAPGGARPLNSRSFANLY